MSTISLQKLIQQSKKTFPDLPQNVKVNYRTKTITFGANKTIQTQANYPPSSPSIYCSSILQTSSSIVEIEAGWEVIINTVEVINNTDPFPSQITLLFVQSAFSEITLLNKGTLTVKGNITTVRVPISNPSNGFVNTVLGVTLGLNGSIPGVFNNIGTYSVDIDISQSTQQQKTDFSIDRYNKFIGIFPALTDTTSSNIINQGTFLIKGPQTKVYRPVSDSRIRTNLKPNAYVLQAVASRSFLNTSSGIITVLPRYQLERCRCRFSIYSTFVNFGLFDFVGQTPNTEKIENKGVFNVYANTRLGGGDNTEAENIPKTISVYQGWQASLAIDTQSTELYQPPNSSSSTKGIIQRYQCFYRQLDCFQEMLYLAQLANSPQLF